MKQPKILSAFLSFALGMAALSCAPKVVNAIAEKDLSAVTVEDKNLSAEKTVTETVKYTPVTTMPVYDNDEFVTTTTAACTGNVISTRIVYDEWETYEAEKVYASNIAIDMYEPTVDYEHSAISVGEKRKIYFHHPNYKERLTLSTVETNDCVTYDYVEGDDYITVEGVKEGIASITIEAEECQLPAKIILDIVPADADIIKKLDATDAKILYKKGESLDISGIQAKVLHPDGKEEMISLESLDLSEITILSVSDSYWKYKSGQEVFNDHLYYQLYGENYWDFQREIQEKYNVTYAYDDDYENFPSYHEGRYVVYLGKKNKNCIELDGKKYYLDRNFRYAEDPHAGYIVYVDDEETPERMVQIKSSKVTNALYRTEGGIEIEGLEEKLYIDDKQTDYKYWNLPHLYKGKLISGIMYFDENNKLINGELKIDKEKYEKYDANCDDEISMADAVLIMQALANPDKYGENGTHENHITAQGIKNADNDGDGMTNADALAIQKRLLNLK